MYPILFHIGSFAVHTYGVVLMVAFVLGIGRAYLAARRQQNPAVPPDNVLDAGIWMVVAGIIGARLLFVLLDWNVPGAGGSYREHPANAFRIWEGGVSFHGAFFGALLALIVYCARRRIPFFQMADVLAPSAMLGYAIGRVGCFLNGCCYGAPTNLPWGVRFFEDGRWTPPSHPTQLYSTALSLLFFAFLVRLERRRAFPGQLLCWYVLLSAVERFVMEIWRAGTTSDVVALGLTDVQWLCLAMAAAALVGLQALRRRSPAPPPAEKRALEVAGR